MSEAWKRSSKACLNSPNLLPLDFQLPAARDHFVIHTLRFRHRFAGCTQGWYIGNYSLFGRLVNGSIGTGVQELVKLAFVLL